MLRCEPAAVCMVAPKTPTSQTLTIDATLARVLVLVCSGVPLATTRARELHAGSFEVRILQVLVGGIFEESHLLPSYQELDGCRIPPGAL